MKPCALIILDGWGIAPPGPGNAISKISSHFIKEYEAMYPHTELLAAGESVGLPQNEAGNSETGHINIGAGRIIEQDLTRINRSITDGSFENNASFLNAITHAQTNHTNIHIMGLLSDEGVHASAGHLLALLNLMEKHGVEKQVYLHLFTDGRDSLPKSAYSIYTDLEHSFSNLRKFTVSSVMGRYYGMDRDKRWERTEKAFKTLTDKSSNTAVSMKEAIELAYNRLETDEFIEPTAIVDENGNIYPRIQNKDSVIFFNYRIDRTRQITKFLIDKLPDLFFVTMTEYEASVPCHVAYAPISVIPTLGSIIEEANLQQLHAAESEKERFVTYYFNGMKEEPFVHEERIIVPSPKVATYDKTPPMSAVSLTDSVIDAIQANTYDFIVMNYANPDMVGHSGNIEATTKACQTVDGEVARVVGAMLEQGGTVIITADHGHAEEMISNQNETQTEHTRNPVPCIICNDGYRNKPTKLVSGVLGDIAPTVCYLMGLKKPVEMTGRNLLDGVV